MVRRADLKSQLSPQELALIEPGSSMGGARPKVSVQDGTHAWLLKFARQGDVVYMAKLEFASMSFLKERLGLSVPALRIIVLGQGDNVFGIKRFDRGAGASVHYVSANSLFNVDELRVIRDSRRNPYSYCNLASILRKHSEHYKQDCHELFTRMVANIAMGNTDDHARNHAMLYDLSTETWALSPAFDMLPVVNTKQDTQSMGVGLSGAEATIENALSCHEHFLLTPAEVKDIVDRVCAAYQDWPSYCEAAGISKADLGIITRVCRVL